MQFNETHAAKTVKDFAECPFEFDGVDGGKQHANLTHTLHHADSIAGRFRALIAQIRRRDADVPLLINSVMPRGAKYIDTITTINGHFREIAQESGADYLDLWPTLATPARTLRKEFTPDGLHLNGEGYRAWASVLRPAIDGMLAR